MADNAWLPCGVGAEIVTRVVEELQGGELPQIKRVGFEFVTCPTTPAPRRRRPARRSASG